MLAYRPRIMGGGVKCGALMHALLASAIVLSLPVFAGPAHAFKLFGFELFGSDDEAADIVDPLRYTVSLNVEGGDEDLTEALTDASDMVADEERPVSGSLGLLSKAGSERQLLIAELYRLARYDGVVDIRIDGKPLDALPPDAEFGAGPVPVTINVTPGNVFTLGDVALKGDAANLMPATFGLIPRGNAGSDAVLKAEALIVRTLKEEGRPLAKVTNRDIVADHATSTLDVTLTVEAGPIAGYGDTTVEGTDEVDRDFAGYMAGLKRGDTYSPQEIEDARDRLINLGVFNSVSLQEGAELDGNGTVPIGVEVSERKKRYYGIGATYSNTEGFGIEGFWGHRNLFGRAEKLRIEGSISGIGDTSDYGKLDYNAAIMFEKPGVVGPASKFFSRAEVVAEHPDAYDRFSANGGVGLAYDLTRNQNLSAELGIDYSDIDDAFGSARHLIVSIPLQYVYDNRNDRLNPTKGWRLLAFVEPSYDALTSTPFVKLEAEASTYQSLDADGKYVAAARVATGSIFGAAVQDVPADRRFYAGGGGSVRGYAYQGIGPKDPAGQPTGGLSFLETSVEMRIAVSETFGIVPFIDAGTVSENEYYPDLSTLQAGAGIGVRYLTPFGPLRVDAAIPLNREPGDPDFGIYAGVGQAF